MLVAQDKEFYELIGRMIADQTFRDQAAADRQAAARSLGYELTAEQENALEEGDLASLATERDEDSGPYLAPTSSPSPFAAGTYSLTPSERSMSCTCFAIVCRVLSRSVLLAFMLWDMWNTERSSRLRRSTWL